MRETISRVGRVLLNIVLVLVIVSTLSMVFSGIIIGKPSVFGFRVLHVVSGSMEPTIQTDQFILVQISDGSDLEVGDIVVYEKEVMGYTKLIVHRVIEIYEENSETYYVFKGDNNAKQDEDPVPASKIVYEVIKY